MLFASHSFYFLEKKTQVEKFLKKACGQAFNEYKQLSETTKKKGSFTFV
jgi:uncharacterized protein YigE (DUF2233 family)